MKTRDGRGARWSFSAGEYGSTVRLREHRGWIHAKINGHHRSLRHKDREKAKQWAIDMAARLTEQSGQEGFSRFLKLRRGVVYVLLDDDRQMVKIGWTSDLARRMEYFTTDNPLASLLCWFPAKRAVERELHKRFAPYRVMGEWFSIEGSLKEFLQFALTEPRLEETSEATQM